MSRHQIVRSRAEEERLIRLLELSHDSFASFMLCQAVARLPLSHMDDDDLAACQDQTKQAKARLYKELGLPTS